MPMKLLGGPGACPSLLASATLQDCCENERSVALSNGLCRITMIMIMMLYVYADDVFFSMRVKAYDTELRINTLR